MHSLPASTNNDGTKDEERWRSDAAKQPWEAAVQDGHSNSSEGYTEHIREYKTHSDKNETRVLLSRNTDHHRERRAELDCEQAQNDCAECHRQQRVHASHHKQHPEQPRNEYFREMFLEDKFRNSCNVRGRLYGFGTTLRKRSQMTSTHYVKHFLAIQCKAEETTEPQNKGAA